MLCAGNIADLWLILDCHTHTNQAHCHHQQMKHSTTAVLFSVLQLKCVQDKHNRHVGHDEHDVHDVHDVHDKHDEHDEH